MLPAPQPSPSGCLSWPAVIIALVIFWPVGLILLGARLSHDRAKQMALGGVFVVIGIGIMLLFIPFAVVGFIGIGQGESGAAPASIMLVAFAAGGFALAAKGQSLRRKRRKVQHYVGLIVNQGMTRVDEIAIATGRSDFNKVMGEIQQLIVEGFLPGYRMDTNSRMVVCLSQHQHTPEEVGFTCRSCGANNMVLALGAYVRCEYCGTPIKAGLLGA